MQESSSSEKPQQSRTRSPSSLSNTSWISLSESPSQVDLINTALTSARTLHRVRSGRLESSDSPIHRQVLERALSRQLGKRLSQLSLPSSNQESLSEETPTSTESCPVAIKRPLSEETPTSTQNSQTRCPDPTRPNTETSPRTSSPLNPNLTHYLAPQTPTSPSSSFETVFFPNKSLLIAPIGEAILPIALVTVDLSDTPTPSESLVSEAMAVLDDEEKKLKGIVRKIKAKIDSSPIDDLIDVEMIPQYKSKQDELVSLLEDLHQGVAEICEEYEAQLGATRLNAWTTTLTETRTKVSQYKKNVVAEIKNLRQASDSAGSTSGAAVPQSLNSTVEQERLSFDKDKQLKQEKRVQAEAETRCKAVTEDATRFAKKFPINSSDWCSEENNKVEAAMKDIHNWEKEMQALRKEAREVEILVTGHSLADTDGNIGHMKTRVDDTVKLLDRTIKQIKELDSVRNLNSLSAKKTDFVKLPKYGGKPDEDFIVFKKKMEKGFVSNNIPTDDQVEKLRENLLDAAKIIVPENTDTIERAWDLLQAAYGSEDRLMQTRKDKLAAMGHLPEAGLLAKGGHSKRVTWCLELERVLADIIELGNRSDELAKEAFSKSSIDMVIKMFPADRRREMIRLPGTGCNKLEGIVEIVETERQLYQEDDKYVEKKAPARKQDSNAHAAYASPDSAASLPNPRGYQSFRKPIKLSNCRICKVLEGRGDTQNLYDNHNGNYATGCPRYSSMTTEERFDVSKEAKICLRCLDPKATWVFREGHKGCPVSKSKKNKFSCTNPNCSWHSWICVTHKDDNKELFERFTADLAKRGLPFVFHSIPCVTTSPLVPASPVSPLAPNAPALSSGPFSTRDTSKDLTREQAVEKLRKLTPHGVKLDTEPKGYPLFMFGSAEGKTRSVCFLYDGGCSDCLMDESVPGKELEGVKVAQGPFPIGAVGGIQVMAKDAWMVKIKMVDGSCQILEGLSVEKVTSEFPEVDLNEAVKEVKASKPKDTLLQNVSIPQKVGGKVDILLGIKYNAFFPVLIHMLPNGLGIYRLKVKSFGNKSTAVIAGPHSSFDKLLAKVGNAAYLLQLFTEGLQTWRTLGAPKLKEVRCSMMTEEEMTKARHLNGMEFGVNCQVFQDSTMESVNDGNLVSECHQLESEPPDLVSECPQLVSEPSDLVAFIISEFRDISAEIIAQAATAKNRLTSTTRDDFLNSPLVTKKNDDIEEAALTKSEVCESVLCEGCGIEVQLKEESEEVNDEAHGHLSAEKHEGSNKMKKLAEVQDAGLQIDYRCPKCRQCSDCLKPIETEKVSIREEAEMVAISESVRLDMENKRIICNLPLRGKEREFLSTNKAQAEKILNQQCNKYFKDEATRPVILKAFKKLFDNGHAQLLRDLPKETVEKILSKEVQHHIPWRVVFKESVSTPARPVLDASSNTPFRADGTGGRSLNDATMKGRVPDMNLLRMVLRFCIGSTGVTGDLSQFYNVFKLVEKQWNLQLFLWKEDLDPASETLVGVIRTLIYGVKSVAAQSEAGVEKLAKYIEQEHPVLAEFLQNSRYVDDLGDSKASLVECSELAKKADELFAKVGMKVKEWGFTGTAPSEKTSADGRTVSFGGMLWDPMLDTLEPKIPPCHFGTVARGRVKIGTEIFGGSMENDMEKFVPSKITPRQVSSKYLSFYDILQLFMPVTAGMKRDLRRVMKETDGWDTAISVELRSKWVKNLWIIEKLKGMKFGRAKMPEDAVSEEMRMLVLVDAAKMLIVVGVWVGFQRKSGEWSCSYLIGRCLLTAEDSTTPKDELNGLTVGGNICYLVRNSLLNWVTTYAVCCDSTIALHWAKSNKLKLSLFHRNRVVQVRRTIDLDNIYHVVTDKNLADLPTRPDKVDLSDVGPLSTWHSGLEWMRDDLKKAIDDKTITPLDKLSMPEEDKEDFEKGFVYEKTKDILTRGHIVTIVHCGVTLNKERIDLVYSRAAYTGYLILPTKFHFPAIVRIMGIVWRFIKSFKCLKGKLKTKPTFNMLSATGGVCSEASMTAAFASNVQSEVQALAVDESNNKKAVIIPTDEDISDALTYLFRVATKEVKEFVKPEIIKKIAVESQGILYSKSRVMDGQRFTLSGDMKDSRILANQGIIIHTPLVERFSPLAYSIGHYVHENLARHSGYETCNRTSLGFCLILKGIGLYEELGNECTTCKKLRKRFIEVSMGPVSSHQFAVCPLFWVTQGDLFGPLTHYVPGRERNTRRTPALDSKCYAFVMVCVVTKLVNIQIVETKDVGGISCALTRLGCEIGMPKLFLTDKDSGIMATLKGVKLELLDVKLRINKEHGVRFETCPVAGHNAHGLVERKIKTAQELMDKCGIANARMHTTGLQTTAKLVENMMNNTPYGYSYGRSQTNTKLMKLVSPNMMKIGRIHSRTINAPVKLPDGPATMMDKVEKAYNVFYKLYNDTMVAKLIQETNAKWFRSSEDLKVDDVVYFRKAEGSVIKGEWTVGAVESVKFGRDGLVREATVKYCNPSENIPRYTTRAARSLVRLFNVEDCHWKTDMEEVRKMLKTMNINAVVEDKPDDATDDTRKTDTLERDPTLCKCCCESHCSLSLHVSRGVALVKQSRFKQPEVDLGLSVKQPGWDYRVDELDDYIGEEMSLANAEDNFANDTVMGLMTALNMDLS